MVFGGGRSHERTRLWPKFPVNRENTGNFCSFSNNFENSPELAKQLQYLTGKFPKIINREFKSDSREIYLRNRELE